MVKGVQKAKAVEEVQDKTKIPKLGVIRPTRSGRNGN